MKISGPTLDKSTNKSIAQNKVKSAFQWWIIADGNVLTETMESWAWELLLCRLKGNLTCSVLYFKENHWGYSDAYNRFAVERFKKPPLRLMPGLGMALRRAAALPSARRAWECNGKGTQATNSWQNSACLISFSNNGRLRPLPDHIIRSCQVISYEYT